MAALFQKQTFNRVVLASVTALTMGMMGLTSLTALADNLSDAQALVGTPAPAFTLKDANGKTRSLSDFKGKFVVLEWTNFGCPFVKAHYSGKNMQSLQAKYTAKKVQWLTINSSAKGKQGYLEGDALKQAITQEGLKSTAYLIDADGTVGKLYKAKTTPDLVVIDPKGKVIYAGAIDDKATIDAAEVPSSKNYIKQVLDEALAGKPLTVSATKSYGCSVKYPD